MEYDTPVQSCIMPVKYTSYDEIKEACGSVLGSFSSRIAGKKMKVTLDYDQRQHMGGICILCIPIQSNHNTEWLLSLLKPSQLHLELRQGSQNVS